MKTKLKIGRRRGREQRAFTLLEVMIAIGIFAMAVFAILGLVSSSLENARRLQRPFVDASPVAGYLLQTNILVEGVYEADLGDFLGRAYKGYQVTYAVQEVETNKFFQVDFVMQNPDRGRAVVSKMTALYFKPQSPAGSLDGGTFGR
jgi:prepilin-type N-terminal cleavage/methylation domain-containing protein